MYIELDGNMVEGKAIVSTPDTLTATMSFRGTLHQGSFLRLKETELISGSKLTEYEWCLKQYSLFLRRKENEMYLVGFWTGVSPTSVCIPGKIKLKRRINRP